MATIVEERRKRGFFGCLMALAFWGWQALMVAWAISTSSAVTNTISTMKSEAERTGGQIGAGIAVIFIIMVWAAGSVVFGMLMFFTRGRKILITREVAA